MVNLVLVLKTWTGSWISWTGVSSCEILGLQKKITKVGQLDVYMSKLNTRTPKCVVQSSYQQNFEVAVKFERCRVLHVEMGIG